MRWIVCLHCRGTGRIFWGASTQYIERCPDCRGLGGGWVR